MRASPEWSVDNVYVYVGEPLVSEMSIQSILK
jgi:hypothetical protein